MGHHFKPEEPLYETAAVLSYEVGQLLETAMYLNWGEDVDITDESVKAGLALIGQAKSRLMDIGAQFQLICESLGVNPEEMTRLGLEKAKERFSRKEYKHFNLKERKVESRFVRYAKYEVMKLDDIDKYLSDEQKKQLNTITGTIQAGRIHDNKVPCNKYVVVNEDMPYAEQVWKLIEEGEKHGLD